MHAPHYRQCIASSIECLYAKSRAPHNRLNACTSNTRIALSIGRLYTRNNATDHRLKAGKTGCMLFGAISIIKTYQRTVHTACTMHPPPCYQPVISNHARRSHLFVCHPLRMYHVYIASHVSHERSSIKQIYSSGMVGILIIRSI